MKNCTDCKHAEWYKTKTGKLSPTGDGMCKYPFKLRKLPACLSHINYTNPMEPAPWINRRRMLTEHCVYYQDRNIK